MIGYRQGGMSSKIGYPILLEFRAKHLARFEIFTAFLLFMGTLSLNLDLNLNSLMHFYLCISNYIPMIPNPQDVGTHGFEILKHNLAGGLSVKGVGGRFSQIGYPFLGRSSKIGHNRIWVGRQAKKGLKNRISFMDGPLNEH